MRNQKNTAFFLRAVCHQMPKARTVVTQPIPPETKVAETIVKGIIWFTGSIPIDRCLAGAERVHDGHVDQTKSDIKCFFKEGRCYIEIIHDLSSCCFFAFIMLYISTISCYAHIVDYTHKSEWCVLYSCFFALGLLFLAIGQPCSVRLAIARFLSMLGSLLIPHWWGLAWLDQMVPEFL